MKTLIAMILLALVVPAHARQKAHEREGFLPHGVLMQEYKKLKPRAAKGYCILNRQQSTEIGVCK